MAILLASLLAFSFYTGHAIITQPASSATRQPVRAGGDGGGERCRWLIKGVVAAAHVALDKFLPALAAAGDIVKGLFNEFKQYMEDASEAALWKVRVA